MSRESDEIMHGVYLLCFDRPFKHARHYLGYSSNIAKRMERHAAGESTSFMRAVFEAGITFELVRVWHGKNQFFERRLKNRGGAKRLCPKCRGISQNDQCE